MFLLLFFFFCACVRTRLPAPALSLLPRGIPVAFSNNICLACDHFSSNQNIFLNTHKKERPPSLTLIAPATVDTQTCDAGPGFTPTAVGVGDAETGCTQNFLANWYMPVHAIAAFTDSRL